MSGTIYYSPISAYISPYLGLLKSALTEKQASATLSYDALKHGGLFSSKALYDMFGFGRSRVWLSISMRVCIGQDVALSVLSGTTHTGGQDAVLGIP